MSQNLELSTEHHGPLISILHKTIKAAIKIRAVLMVLVIFWGVADVFYVIYNHLLAPFLLLNPSDIFKTFAAFLAVLIAIEIFQNIVLYIRTDVFPLRRVMTALMARARKVIIIDYQFVSTRLMFAVAGIILASGDTYYLLEKNNDGSIK
jgi:uncharacterized membrane protein (DUF373 family)